jgi:hypothetical protein
MSHYQVVSRTPEDTTQSDEDLIDFFASTEG